VDARMPVDERDRNAAAPHDFLRRAAPDALGVERYRNHPLLLGDQPNLRDLPSHHKPPSVAGSSAVVKASIVPAR
jgi:hypothetical protein